MCPSFFFVFLFQSPIWSPIHPGIAKRVGDALDIYVLHRHLRSFLPGLPAVILDPSPRDQTPLPGAKNQFYKLFRHIFVTLFEPNKCFVRQNIQLCQVWDKFNSNLFTQSPLQKPQFWTPQLLRIFHFLLSRVPLDLPHQPPAGCHSKIAGLRSSGGHTGYSNQKP